MTPSLDSTTAQCTAIERNRALVRWWLYSICALVAAMVIVGGATRLTDSGLSITEWKPLIGAIPPLNDLDWGEAFAKYRQIPEFSQINSDMTLAGFKFIYWWEWSHRFLGRFIGVAFFFPLALFWATGRLEGWLKLRLTFLFLLGGLQGFIGWWMVKSGLVERVDVSQYRLATHLLLACVIFALAMWIARGLAPHSTVPGPASYRRQARSITMLVLLQVFLGALVAGLDAGLTFNTWPKMDGSLIPGGLWVQKPLWLNLFENHKMVQFVHRTCAYLIFSFALFHVAVGYANKLQSPHKARALLLFLLVAAQATLGVVALLKQVPFEWAIAHQFGAIIVLGFAVAHWRGLKGPYPAVVEIRGSGQFGR